MIPKGLFTQIAMIILAVATVMTYIVPTFQEIGIVQNNIATFTKEREKIGEINDKLSKKVAELDSISSAEQKKLFTYMPNKVDLIAVQKDLFAISNEAGVIYLDSQTQEKAKNQKTSSNDGVDNSPQAYTLSLLVEGTYGQLKKLFSLLEVNDYPLEVSSLQVTKLDGSFLSANIELVTYEHKKPVTSVSNQIEF